MSLCPVCLMRQGLITEGGAETAEAQLLAQGEIARLFPQFEVIECLGRGGMGVIYKARQKSLDRLVALKILAPERSQSPEFVQWFSREARTLAQLNHPNIVTVHEFGESQGVCLLAMEFVEGKNLRPLIQEGKTTPAEARALFLPICDALQYAHDKGVVHRDIKPENLLVDPHGRVKVADFGIAEILQRGASSPGDSGGKRQVTGTPRYMAPEQKDPGAASDHRVDIYALGVVLHELLTGKLPGPDSSPLPHDRSGLPLDAELAEVLHRALDPLPEKRFQQVRDLRTAVEAIGASAAPPSGERRGAPPGRGRVRKLVAGGAVATAVVGIAIWPGLRQEPDPAQTSPVEWRLEADPVWSLAPGERPYLTTANSERGIAFNPSTGRLYVVQVSGPGDLVVAILDGATGEDLGRLSVAGVAGGFQALRKIRVLDDGTIFAGNITTDAREHPYRLYRWESETADPVLVWEGDPSNGAAGALSRFGDNLAVRRGEAGGVQILLAPDIFFPRAFQRETHAVALLTSGDEGTVFALTTLSTQPTTRFGQGVDFGEGSTFWGTRYNQPLREFDFNGALLRELTGSVFPAAVFSVRTDHSRGILAAMRDNILEIYSYPHLSTTEPNIPNSWRSFPGRGANQEQTGDIAFGFDGMVYALNTNKGLIAYRIVAAP
jgi:serine/threonine protein kinase